MPELPAVAVLLGLCSPREGQASQALGAVRVLSSLWAKGSSAQRSSSTEEQSKQRGSLLGTFLPSRALCSCMQPVENNWLV